MTQVMPCHSCTCMHARRFGYLTCIAMHRASERYCALHLSHAKASGHGRVKGAGTPKRCRYSSAPEARQRTRRTAVKGTWPYLVA